jgi:signal peptidase II
MNKKKHNIELALLSGAALLLLDISTKLWTVSPSFKPIVFIKNFFYLTSFQTNSGIAFGINLPIWLQIIGSIIILVILLKLGDQYIFSENKRLFLKPVLFGIIIGGAIGNLINRILQGYVIDFIVLKPIPVFNIADVGITVGLIGLFIAILINSKKQKS